MLLCIWWWICVFILLFFFILFVLLFLMVVNNLSEEFIYECSDFVIKMVLGIISYLCWLILLLVICLCVIVLINYVEELFNLVLM